MICTGVLILYSTFWSRRSLLRNRRLLLKTRWYTRVSWVRTSYAFHSISRLACKTLFNLDFGTPAYSHFVVVLAPISASVGNVDFSRKEKRRCMFSRLHLHLQSNHSRYCVLDSSHGCMLELLLPLPPQSILGSYKVSKLLRTTELLKFHLSIS